MQESGGPKARRDRRQHEMRAAATASILGYVFDQSGRFVPIRISAIAVPRLGRNFIALAKAM